MVLFVQPGVSEGTLSLLGNYRSVRHPRLDSGTVVPLDYEEHGNDVVRGCHHRVSGLGLLEHRYGGDVFILSLIVSLLLPYSRKWMWVYIIVVSALDCDT